MTTGFLLALNGMILLSFSNIANKKATLRFSPILSSFFYFASTVFFAGLLYMLFGESRMEISSGNLLLLSISGLSGFLTIFALFKSFEYVAIGISLVLFNLYGLWNYLFNIILGKTQDYFFLFSIGIFIAGLTLINDKISDKKRNTLGIFLAITSGLCLAIFSRINSLFIQNGVQSIEVTFYTEFSILIVTCIFLLFSQVKKEIQNYKFLKRDILLIVLLGFLNYFGVLFLNSSYNYIDVFITNLINSSQVVFTIVLAYFILKERISRKQLFGILLILISIISLYFLSK